MLLVHSLKILGQYSYGFGGLTDSCAVNLTGGAPWWGKNNTTLRLSKCSTKGKLQCFKRKNQA